MFYPLFCYINMYLHGFSWHFLVTMPLITQTKAPEKEAFVCECDNRLANDRTEDCVYHTVAQDVYLTVVDELVCLGAVTVDIDD